MNHRSCPLLLSLLLVLAPAGLRAEDEIPPWPVGETAGNAYVATYGELLNVYDDAAKAGGTEAQKALSEKLGFYNQTLGRVAGAIDVGGKLYAGDTGEAAVSAGLTVLGELAGSATGKAMLAGAGLSTAPVTAAIFALQVGMASQKELDASTAALEMEVLYGSIESDPVLRNRARELGVGDPIPVTPEAIEHVWRKIYFNSNWQRGFKAYVVNELGKEWPEQSYWDSVFLPAGNAADDAALLERKDEYKPYIAGLLGHLNKMARSREQFLLARRHLDQLRQAFSALSQDQLLRNYTSAVQRLPEVKAFVAKANAALPTASPDALLELAGTAKRYATDVLAFLPVSGRLGIERQQLSTALRGIHDDAWRRRGASTRTAVAAATRAAEAIRAPTLPTRFGGLQAYDAYAGLIADDFARGAWQAAGPRYDGQGKPVASSIAPTALARFKEEGQAIDEHYRRQADSFLAGNPNEGERSAWFKAASLLRRADEEARAGTLALVEDDVRQRLSLVTQQESLLSAEFRSRIEATSAPLQVAEKTAGTLAGYCLNGGDGIRVPGYLGIVRYSFPKATTAPGAYELQRLYEDYLQRLRSGVAESNSITLCGTRAASARDAVAWLPALATGLREAGAGADALVLLREGMTDLRERVAKHPWLVPSTRDYLLKQLDERLAAISAGEPALKQANAAADTVAALVTPLQTMVLNMDNDLEYLSRLQSIVGRLQPAMNEFQRPYRGEARFSRLGEPRLFLLRPGIGTECSALVGQRPLMSAADFEQMWKDLDRALVENRLAWLSEHYGLELGEAARKWMALRLGKAEPARDYLFLGGAAGCQYREPDDLGALADALATLPADARFGEELSRLNGKQQGLLSLVFGFTYGDDGRIDVTAYDPALLAPSCAIARSYWNEPARAAFARVCDSLQKAVAGYRSYQDKEAYFSSVEARMAPLWAAFSNGEWVARAAYNRDSTATGVPVLYRTAIGTGEALAAALAAASSDAGLSPARQAQLGGQAKDVALRLHSAREMLRNLEQQEKGRQAGQAAAQRLARITAFYAGFERAYERKDLSRLMAMLGQGWRAADGTRLSEVEEHFRNMFDVFDEIQVSIGEVTVGDTTPERVTVSYTLSIRGLIHELGTEHVEESSVTEAVANPDGGDVRILQTLQGRFWYR